MCEKIITEGSARNRDPCLKVELKELENTFPRFKKKFRTIMSCCGHYKYSKTLVVQNIGSGACFEWFSGTTLVGTRRADSRAPYYKRDREGYYFIPEVDKEIGNLEAMVMRK